MAGGIAAAGLARRVAVTKMARVPLLMAVSIARQVDSSGLRRRNLPAAYPREMATRLRASMGAPTWAK